MKRLLFGVCTHGDEEVGLQAVRKLKRTSFSKDFDFVIANLMAYARGVRFVDCDLNRCGPGSLKSEKYEERRAAELIALARDYDWVIDLHGAPNKNCGTFIIISKPTWENLLLASWLGIANIVVWSSAKDKPTGPWARFVRMSIEIECGDKLNKETVINLEKKLREFLRKERTGLLGLCLEKNLEDKNLFVVTGKIQDEDYKEKLIDFQATKYQGEEFYPLLAGDYPGINCYQMKKVTSIVDALNPWDLMKK
jgi:succinylglutamate desuccinylase